jgi:hypothetical protein
VSRASGGDEGAVESEIIANEKTFGLRDSKDLSIEAGKDGRAAISECVQRGE